MKRFPKKSACALILALAVWLPGTVRAQTGPSPTSPTGPAPILTPAPQVTPAPPTPPPTERTISAVPGQRPARALPPPQNGGIAMSLDDSIGYALSNDVDLDVSVNTAESTQWGLFQTEGIWDPLLQGSVVRSHAATPASSELTGASVYVTDQTAVSASATQLLPTGGSLSLGLQTVDFRSNSTFSSVNPAKTAGLTLNLNQPLLRNFGYDTTVWLVHIAKDTRDASYQDYVRSVQTTVNSVEQAYWNLVYAVQNLGVKKEALSIAQELNRITKIKIDVGSLAPIEIYQTEFGIATAEQDIITAEGMVGNAQDALKRLLNFDPKEWTTPIVPTDQVRAQTVTIDVEAGVSAAVAGRPEVVKQAYVNATDAIRYQYWKNQTLPGVNLVGSYGTAGLAGQFFVPDPNDPTGTTLIPAGSTPFSNAFTDVFHGQNKNWSLGLNVTYPIFNRAARGQKGVARYVWDSDKALLTTVQQNIIVEVRTDARAIDLAVRQIAAAQKGRILAEENLDAEKKKFDNGMSTTFQVNQVQNALSVARSTELQALTGYRQAIAAYHLAIADILPWKGIKVEGMPQTTPPEIPPLTARQ